MAKDLIPKSKSGIVLLILLVLIILLIFWGISAIQENSNQKNETLYSTESKFNDLVYADIISIDPVSVTSDRAKVATPRNEGYFCSCVTVEGKMINTYIRSTDFNKYIKKSKYSWDPWTSTTPSKVIFDTPLRIHGRISNRKSILNSTNDESLVFYIYKSDRTAD